MKQWALGFLVASIAASPSYSKSVFGDKDPRYAMTSTAYPWSAIGKLSMGCTGTLVWHNLVLTAAHCVINKETNQVREPSGMWFKPNFMGGGSYDLAHVKQIYTYSTQYKPLEWSMDWAILRLDQSLGLTSRYGYLGFNGNLGFYTRIPLELPVTLVGYSTDFMGGNTAGVHHDCKIWGKHPRYNYILHDCATAPGASGGPIIVDGSAFNISGWVVLAVNNAEHTRDVPNPNCPNGTDQNGNPCSMFVKRSYTGESYDDAVANIATPARYFGPVLQELRAKYPWPVDPKSPTI